MALAERWWTSWEPIGQAVTYTLRIKEEGHLGGTTPIESLAKEPLSVRVRGINIVSIGDVVGTEIQFSFWVTPEDGTDYDDLFTATIKKYLIEIEREGVLYFIGYMKPENISRPLIHNRFLVTLSATDGLADLKNFPYKAADGSNYTDRTRTLETIKRALTSTGLALDINIKLGTYESSASLMLITDCAIDKATIDNQRFYKNSDGVLTPETSHQVLSQCIGVFNCSIKQLNGEWYIFNNVEINSFIFNFDWATITQQGVRVAHDPSLAIDAYNFRSKGDVSNRPPLSKVAITFENKYVEDSVVGNSDFSGGLTGWTNGSNPNDWAGTFNVTNEELVCIAGTNFSSDKEFISDSFSVTELSDTDKIILTIRAKVGTLSTETNLVLPVVLATIVGPNGTHVINLGRMSEVWAEQNHSIEFNTLGTGNYTIKISVTEVNYTADYIAHFDDINMFIDYGELEKTNDKLITISNDAAVDENIAEYTTRIGDSVELNDQGSIKICGTLTSEWDTYGNTEGENIIDLLGAFQLNARQAFVKYLRLNIKDPSDNIDIGAILVFDSVYYRIIRFKKQYKNITVDVDLLEINT